jgi:hypothetical protein
LEGGEMGVKENDFFIFRKCPLSSRGKKQINRKAAKQSRSLSKKQKKKLEENATFSLMMDPLEQY